MSTQSTIHIPTQSVINLTWTEVELAIHRLVEKIVDQGLINRFDLIVGVTRGGCIPAVMLSHILKISRVSFINAITYNAANDRIMTHIDVPNVVSKQVELLGQRNVLVVDDIVDSQQTMSEINMFWPSTTKACIISKVADNIEPKIPVIYGRQLLVKEWIKFPWELERQEEYDM